MKKTSALVLAVQKIDFGAPKQFRGLVGESPKKIRKTKLCLLLNTFTQKFDFEV